MKSFPFAELLRPEIADLKAYAPHEGQFDVRLDANEAPALLSEGARARLAEVAGQTAWERYPDASELELRTALGARSGVGAESVLVGCGSDELLSLLVTAFDRPRLGARSTTLATVTPTFVMYRMAARVRGVTAIEVPLDRDWDLDVAGFERALAMMRPNLVLLASPNNPTGRLMSADRLEAVVRAAHDAVVVVDEAYVDYAPRTQLGLLERHSNVAVLRTLSKIGFAALRVGWLVADPALIGELDKVRMPYNVPTPSQRVATVALRELGSEIDHIIEVVRRERDRVTEALERMGGLTPTPSDANFIWVRTESPAGEVHARLAGNGVLVRSFHASGGRLAHQLRITIGAPADNDRLLEVLPSCV